MQSYQRAVSKPTNQTFPLMWPRSACRDAAIGASQRFTLELVLVQS